MAPAELVAVAGPLAGEHYSLGAVETTIGRAPECVITIPTYDAAWRHCSVKILDGDYYLIDGQNGTGTFVNGLKARKQKLEHGDQLSIGETTLLFSTGDAVVADTPSASDTLLRACTVLQLVRAIAILPEGPQRQILERQFIALLGDLLPVERGVILLGESPVHLLQQARSFSCNDAGFSAAVRDLVPRAIQEGASFDAATRAMAAPLISATEAHGAIVVRCPKDAIAEIDRHRDALAALATLGSTGLQTAREVQTLRIKASLLEEALETNTGIVGESPAIKRLLTMIEKVAPQDATVLILGESGTGKELIARAIHKRSKRNARPFVAINCAALSDTLLESELFGHEKGAFTGAVAQKKGKFEVAQGGTVFLDEVGEMAAPLQAKLLRVLQEREFERVGSTQTMRLDVRLIAATNRDLAAEVERGTFRQDLYHRLNVVVLRSPALRERREDIPALARHFVRLSSARCHRRIIGISKEAEAALMSYNWPGNVRELENSIERAVVLGESDVILAEDLPETLYERPEDGAPIAPIFASVGDAKRNSIIRAWNEARGDYKGAAAILGVHPNSLLRLIRTLSLRDDLPRY